MMTEAEMRAEICRIANALEDKELLRKLCRIAQRAEAEDKKNRSGTVVSLPKSHRTFAGMKMIPHRQGLVK